MNPFDWRGPQFLGFYLCVSGLGFVLMYLVSRGVFTGSPRLPTGEARRHLRDPYLLSYLRGGASHALQTVAFSLHKRKLLSSSGAFLAASGSRDALQAVRNPLERALLSLCGTPRKAADLMQHRDLRRAVDIYIQPLRNSGLVADGAEFSRRMPGFIAIAGTLAALGALKVIIALQRGHANVAFLVVLTLLVLTVVTSLYRRRRTNAGDQALADQQTLFGRLRNRVQRLAADGATDEAVLVAATFGLDALPSDAYPFAKRLRRNIQNNSSNSCSSGCGSSCGGGGCGGGCGGCGS